MVNNKLIIVQANTQNSRQATIETKTMADSIHADIICLQEPYTYHRDGKFKITGYTALKCAHKQEQNPLAAICIANKDIDATFNSQLSSRNVVVCMLRYGTLKFVLISVYMPWDQDLAEHITSIQNALNEYRNIPIILTGDVNAKSAAWHSKRTNARGSAVEDLINANDLFIINQAGQPYTFSTANGEDNIDLTVASGQLINRLNSWKVLTNGNSSDHRPIQFEIDTEDVNIAVENKYCIRKIDLGALENASNELNTELEIYPVDSAFNIDTFIQRLTQGLLEVTHRSCKISRSKGKTTPWWNDHLSVQKTQVNRARRVYQQLRRRNGDWLWARGEYRRRLSMYKNQMKNCKENSWRNFLEEQLADNPWGVVYKLAADKLKPNNIQHSVIKRDGTSTLAQEDTLTEILEKLMPDDNPEDDLPVHTEIRQQALEATGNEFILVRISEDALVDAVTKISPYRAPGKDQVHGKIIALSFKQIHTQLLKLYQACFRIGYFPKAWKTGRLVAILKSPDKDPTDPKSYRPISLLSELGKILERLILNQIHTELPEANIFSDSQYGFRKGRSTVDALTVISSNIRSVYTHSMAIYIDISGAFDNLWWPSLIIELENRGISRDVLKISQNYLKDRSVEFSTNYTTVVKPSTKGCPQGSVLGPTYWNFAMDTVLRRAWPVRSRVTAYADDLTIVIGGDSRQDLEGTAAECMTILSEWSIWSKLNISETKTKYVVFTGLSLMRNPTVRYQGRPIQRATEIKCLGIVIDQKLNYAQHINYIADKCRKIFQSLRRTLRRNWGRIDKFYRALSEIYLRVIIPILSYGIQLWGHRITQVANKRKLRTLQASCLRTIIGAYSSTPCETVCALSKFPPLHIHLKHEQALKDIKQTGRAFFMGYEILAGNYRYWKDLKNDMLDKMVQLWQTEWENSSKGRFTNLFFPNINDWLKTNSDPLPRKVVHVLSGHGNSKLHLHRIGKAESSDCATCSTEDSPIHRILYCTDYDLQRQAAGIMTDRFPLNPADIIMQLAPNLAVLADFEPDNIE